MGVADNSPDISMFSRTSEVMRDLPGTVDLLGSGVVIELSVCEGSYLSADPIAKRRDLPITMPWTANCIVKV